MLNITGARSIRDEKPDRQALERELLDEMATWMPRDRGGAFKTWHRHALSLVHLTVLTALESEGPLAMKQLAETLDVSDASATGIVDRMAKRGLVERKHGTDDRRVVLVHATEAGKTIFEDMAARRREVMARIIGELTADEIGSLLVGMRAVQAARGRVLASIAATEATAGETSGDQLTDPLVEPRDRAGEAPVDEAPLEAASV
jgi:DNA-binding MarR family transcriptional regulator